MKKYLFFATALAALASCTSNDYIGEDTSSTTNQSEQAAIAFGSGVKTVTRADYYGADAASKLNEKFIVGGFKGTTTASSCISTVYTDGDITTSGVPATDMVYDNYQVHWTANTAGTTQSNTSGWEYVGLEFAHPSTLVNGSGENHAVQSIKYWDYSAEQYDFIAYSTGNAVNTYIGDGVENETESAAKTRATDGNKVLVTAIDAAHAATKAYELTGKAAELEKCYIADMITAYKVDKTPTQPKFQDEIQFQFRALASKVRVAIYETIPGYSVKDVKFYKDATTKLNSTTEGDKVDKATLFTTGGTGDGNAMNYFYTAGTCTVYYPTIGSANISNSDYNKAHVKFDATSKETIKQFDELNYTTKEKREKTTGDIWLGRTSAQASFAGDETNKYYQIAMPNEDGTVLELRIDYTLESLDGSGEEIKVYGATAFVPAIYAAWKSNYAYTYIFKISDNTNGWTNKANAAQNNDDPAGLYPITFDAVVLETQDNTQSTITTVATPSITTYQKGHINTDNEYEADATKGDIFVQVMDNNASPATLKNDLNTKGKLYEVAASNAKDKDGVVTEAEIMDALNIVSLDATPVPMNGWTLTEATTTYPTAIPGADGNNITVPANTAAQFTPTAGKVYAYVYTISTGTQKFVGIAKEHTTAPADWSTAEYFTNKNCTTAAPTDFTPGIYYQKAYKDNQNAYGVKIIRTKP